MTVLGMEEKRKISKDAYSVKWTKLFHYFYPTPSSLEYKKTQKKFLQLLNVDTVTFLEFKCSFLHLYQLERKQSGFELIWNTTNFWLYNLFKFIFLWI